MTEKTMIKRIAEKMLAGYEDWKKQQSSESFSKDEVNKK